MMRKEDIKVCVLRIEGTNCEEEMFQAFKELETSPEKVHLKQLIGQCPEGMRRDLEDYRHPGAPGRFLRRRLCARRCHLRGPHDAPP